MTDMSRPAIDRTIDPVSVPSIRAINDISHREGGSRRLFVGGGARGVALAAASGLLLGGLVNTVQAAPMPPSLALPGIGAEAQVSQLGAGADEGAGGRSSDPAAGLHVASLPRMR